MRHLQNFFRSLRRSSQKHSTHSEAARQRTDLLVDADASFWTGPYRSQQKPHEGWPPNEADYNQASRLRDSAHGYELELWRLWGL
jgi:hypothetical protein